MSGLRARAAIVGIGETPLGRVPTFSVVEMYIQAMRAALDDAGMTWDDVDGLYPAQSRIDPFGTGAAILAEHVGIHPSFALTMPMGGMQYLSAVYQAAAVIEAGVAETIMLVSADKALSEAPGGGVQLWADTAHPYYEVPYGPPLFSLYAMIATRHMHEFGTTPEQLAAVAVSTREHATRHPRAERREPITVDDVLRARMSATPFHRLECSLISDGGGAVVVTSADRARHCLHEPIWLLGAGEARTHLHIAEADDLTRLANIDSGRRAFRMAGLEPKDVDLACLYDPFAIVPIVTLEGLGFCGRGEGGPFVESGATRPDGSLPINPHGG